jgi:hypothetical protein
VSSVLNILAALPPEKESPLPTAEEAGWAQSLYGSFGKEINLLPLAGIRP